MRSQASLHALTLHGPTNFAPIIRYGLKGTVGPEGEASFGCGLSRYVRSRSTWHSLRAS